MFLARFPVALKIAFSCDLIHSIGSAWSLPSACKIPPRKQIELAWEIERYECTDLREIQNIARMQSVDITVAPGAAVRASLKHGDLLLQCVLSELQMVRKRGNPDLQ